MGWLSLALITVFTVILTATVPSLWLEPFGPLAKNLPLMGATLAMMATADP
jgi:hypothetical protein